MVESELADRKKAEISLMGQQFLVRSEYDEEYIKKLATFIDQEMNKIRATTRSRSNSHLTLLVALNLADRLFTQEAQIKTLKVQMEQVLNSTLIDLDIALEQLQKEGQGAKMVPTVNCGQQPIQSV